MWLRTLLLVVLIVLVVRALTRLIRGIMRGASSGTPGRRPSKAPGAVHMVADPVCGTFVVPGKALHAGRGNQTHYFCSAACRDKWEAAH